MEIIDRLKLHGKNDENTEPTDDGSVSLTWTNDNNITEILEITFVVIGHSYDGQTDFSNLRWEAFSTVKDTTNDVTLVDNEFVGWGGQEFKQYDNRGCRTSSKTIIVKIKPNTTNIINLNLNFHDEDDPVIGGSENIVIKQKKIIAHVIGTRE